MNRRTRIKKDQFSPGVDKQVLQVVGKDTMWASLSTAFPDGEDGQIIRRRNGLISWDSFPEASELQNSLDAKADKATTYTKEQVYTKEQTDTKATELAKAEINKLVDGAPAALDTLKEIADKISAGDSVAAALAGEVSRLDETKADKNALLTHTHPLATQTQPGFMSATDKTKLDGLDNVGGGQASSNLVIYEAVTETAPDNAYKIATSDAPALSNGMVFLVTFSKGNGSLFSMSLKIGDNAPKPVRCTYGDLGVDQGFVPAGGKVYLVYNNEEFRTFGPTYNAAYQPMSWDDYVNNSHPYIARLVSSGVLNNALKHNKHLRHAGPIKMLKDVRARTVVVGTDAGYQEAAPGVRFFGGYPILVSENAVSKNAHTQNTYLSMDSVDLSVQKPGVNFSDIGMTYLEVAPDSEGFFVITDNVFTSSISTTEDNKVYIPIGMRYSNKNLHFHSCPVPYYYSDGVLKIYSPEVKNNFDLLSIGQAIETVPRSNSIGVPRPIAFHGDILGVSTRRRKISEDTELATTSLEGENLFKVVFMNKQNRVFQINIGYALDQGWSFRYYKVTDTATETLLATDFCRPGEVFSSNRLFKLTATSLVFEAIDQNVGEDAAIMTLQALRLLGLEGVPAADATGDLAITAYKKTSSFMKAYDKLSGPEHFQLLVGSEDPTWGALTATILFDKIVVLSGLIRGTNLEGKHILNLGPDIRPKTAVLAPVGCSTPAGRAFVHGDGTVTLAAAPNTNYVSLNGVIYERR